MCWLGIKNVYISAPQAMYLRLKHYFLFLDAESLQAKLSTTDEPTWKEREAAVLALGAIAEGCINGLYPHLSEVIVIL